MDTDRVLVAPAISQRLVQLEKDRAPMSLTVQFDRSTIARVGALLAVFAVSATAIQHASAEVPHTFIKGEPLRAADLRANFQQLDQDLAANTAALTDAAASINGLQSQTDANATAIGANANAIEANTTAIDALETEAALTRCSGDSTRMVAGAAACKALSPGLTTVAVCGSNGQLPDDLCKAVDPSATVIHRFQFNTPPFCSTPGFPCLDYALGPDTGVSNAVIGTTNAVVCCSL
ncbi:MAG: hypothetical protein U0271_39830 [Polyangiaceae bacterium]